MNSRSSTRVASFTALRENFQPLTKPAGNPEAVLAAQGDLHRYVRERIEPLMQQVDELPPEQARPVLYRALLHLQHRYFYLTTHHQLAGQDILPLHDSYESAYRRLEAMVQELDMIQSAMTATPPEPPDDYQVELNMDQVNQPITPQSRRTPPRRTP